ncbi:MAG: hypothetical protein HYY51_03465 [Candidatus Magasanikbacteria bacterium]|nr:hypothetical protein [Candidatus Magasanikbacteria bacterium]
MTPAFSKVEIKEPPIEQLTKKKSCLRRACVSCLGCLGVVIIVSLILLKFTLRPKPVEIKDLPSLFAELVPTYDIEGTKLIKLTKGVERNKGAEYAAFLPKLFISPVVLILDRDNDFSSTAKKDNGITEQSLSLARRLVAFMKAPIADHRDVVSIEWEQLDASADFLEEYYRTELKKRNFKIGITSSNKLTRQFTFSKTGIDGLIFIQDDPSTETTDALFLTVTTSLE